MTPPPHDYHAAVAAECPSRHQKSVADGSKHLLETLKLCEDLNLHLIQNADADGAKLLVKMQDHAMNALMAFHNKLHVGS